MRRVVWAEYVSVDGVVDEPVWTGPFWNEEIATLQKEQLFRSDALLLGRITYEAFAASWPTMSDPDGFADRMNQVPKYVASRSLKAASWNATVLQGDVADAVSRLRREAGRDILMYGSATLAHSLIERDLIDEFRLMIHPIVVGHGRHLFERGASNKTLKLRSTTTTATGIVIAVYEPAR